MYYGFADKLKESDPRKKRYLKQRNERGFDDSETWGLDYTIAQFVLPRLKRFKEVCSGYPGHLTNEEWEDYLDRMIRSFELVIESDKNDDIDYKEMDDGLKLFGEYFRWLWW